MQWMYMEEIHKHLYELHCYWTDVINYDPKRNPDRIIVSIKEQIRELEKQLYNIEYKKIKH